MDNEKLSQAAAPEEFARYLAGLPAPAHHAHGAEGPIETVREAEHDGHRILIRTTYAIEVDGRPLDVPLELNNEGVLHCHALPNYRFDSAVDMVKGLIDNFPEDFPRPAAPPDRPAGGGHHGGHDHAAHGHGAHASAKKRAAKKSSAKKSASKKSASKQSASKKGVRKGGR